MCAYAVARGRHLVLRPWHPEGDIIKIYICQVLRNVPGEHWYLNVLSVKATYSHFPSSVAHGIEIIQGVD